MPEEHFYVYQWVREDGTPYYIGKGKKDRAWKKTKYHVPPVDKSRIKIVAKKLAEHEAFLLEKHLISLYGRKDKKEGILINLTDGGEGPSGSICSEERKRKVSEKSKGNKYRLGIKHSDEVKREMSRSRKGRVHSEESIEKMRASKIGYRFSQEAKDKMSSAKLGKTQSEETKRKRSISLKASWALRKQYPNDRTN